MASLSFQNFSTLVQTQVAAAQSACASFVGLLVGGPILAILEANAAIALWLQYLILLVLQVTRLASSSGTDVDSFGADYGFYRLPAGLATGQVTFSRYTATISAFIPVGATVAAAANTETFTVLADTTNSAYSATLGGFTIPAGTSSLTCTVQAQSAGTQGNVLANTINLISAAIPGVDTVNNAGNFTNGVNAETDTALKVRFQNFLATRALGTPSAVQYAISALGSNLTDSIAEYANPAGTYTPGMFTVYVDDGTGSPPSGTINEVSAAVNATRALGIQYAVQGPSLVTANYTATITVAAGITKANILAAVEAYVAAYINSLPMGAPLPYTKLAQVIYAANPGITNITGLLLNSGTADIGGSPQQVVRAGTGTIS